MLFYKAKEAQRDVETGRSALNAWVNPVKSQGPLKVGEQGVTLTGGPVLRAGQVPKGRGHRGTLLLALKKLPPAREGRQTLQVIQERRFYTEGSRRKQPPPHDLFKMARATVSVSNSPADL